MSRILSRNLANINSLRDESTSLKKAYTPSIVSDAITVFDFDNDVINSDAYRRAYTAFTKNADDIPASLSDVNSELGDLALEKPKLKADEATRQDHVKTSQAPQSSPQPRSKAIIEPFRNTQDVGEALYYAAENGHSEIVQLLLERGANPGSKVDGRLALCEAAFGGHVKVVKLLLDHKGVEIDQTNESGATPLYRAALNDHDEIVRMLLERGAEAALPRFNGWTPISIAAKRGHAKVVKVLLEHERIGIETP